MARLYRLNSLKAGDRALLDQVANQFARNPNVQGGADGVLEYFDRGELPDFIGYQLPSAQRKKIEDIVGKVSQVSERDAIQKYLQGIPSDVSVLDDQQLIDVKQAYNDLSQPTSTEGTTTTFDLP